MSPSFLGGRALRLAVKSLWGGMAWPSCSHSGHSQLQRLIRDFRESRDSKDSSEMKAGPIGGIHDPTGLVWWGRLSGENKKAPTVKVMLGWSCLYSQPATCVTPVGE